MAKGKVIVVQPIARCGIDYLQERGYEVVMGTGTTEDVIAQESVGCDGMLVRNARITKKILDAADKLKVIGRHGVGMDTIDTAYALDKGIVLTNAPLSNFNAVVEHTMFFLLSLAKNARPVDIAYRKGNFDIRHKITNMEVRGKKLAILGLGRIGRGVAHKAIYGFDMDVAGYDPFVKPESLDARIKLCATVAETVRDAEFITVHLPLTQQTRGIINKDLLDVTKHGAYLINAARGEAIVEQDVMDALDSGQLGGGAFDLLSSEPPPADHPFFKYDNVIITPHNAAHTHEAFRNMAMHAAQGIDEVLGGRTPTWPFR